jgi:hypothetical protein
MSLLPSKSSMRRSLKSLNSFSNLFNHQWEVPTLAKFSLEAQKRKRKKHAKKPE